MGPVSCCVRRIVSESNVVSMDVEVCAEHVVLVRIVLQNFSVKSRGVNPSVGTRSAATMAAGVCAEFVWGMVFVMMDFA